MHKVNEYMLTCVVVIRGGIAGYLATIEDAEYATTVILIDQVIMGDRKNGNNSNIKKAL